MGLPAFFKPTIISSVGWDVSQAVTFNEVLGPLYAGLTDNEKRVLRFWLILDALVGMPDDQINPDEIPNETLNLVVLIRAFKAEMAKADQPEIDFDKELASFQELAQTEEA
jgi:hypothetical protein